MTHMTTMPTLPALRMQPLFQMATPAAVFDCASQCAVRHCNHFAKIHRHCLTHHRSLAQMHTPSTPTSSDKACSRPSVGGVSSSGCESALGSPTPDTSAKLKLKNRNRKCRTDACVSYARSGGYCTRHGGGRKCKVDGCGTASQTGGFCRLHGGGSRCRIAQCDQFARIRGLCLHHNRVTPEDAASSSHDSLLTAPL